MAINDYAGNRNMGNATGWSEGQASSWDPASSTVDTGEMRRKYNFSEKFTELSLDQTPFFRIVSKIGKKPTDDPQFKYTEKRQSWMKRYGYAVGTGTADAAILQLTSGTAGTSVSDSTEWLYMATDYKSAGNLQNIIGQSGTSIGDAGTRPEFYLQGQLVKVNVTSANGSAMTDYKLFQVIAAPVAGYACHTTDAALTTAGAFITTAAYDLLDGPAAAKYYECVKLNVKQVKDSSKQATAYLMTYDSSDAFIDAAAVTAETDGSAGVTIAGTLEPRRSYVVGTSYKEGSTLMEQNWGDQPYSTGYGYTQIFRNEFGMSNTARATALKYEKNEWARLWRDKLIEHKWEIEQTALFGSQGVVTGVGSDNDTHYYTQGAVDYVLNNGNLFNLNLSTKLQDDFLEDLSQLVDPRYNNSKSMMFFCDTATYNWLHKLGGFFNNNLEMSTNHSASFAVSGKKRSFGVSFTTISTVYGDINVARNIALDGSGIKILGVNMNYVKWRPLVGNGVNRDTSVYVGVQTLENTGTDKRVDMILTEGGFEWSMPECHALWK
tara:strand:- start:9141 stop:10787 length:1647 start_codon:yes stop_codon:yes gene_type:complete